jgi:hypothetical protein
MSAFLLHSGATVLCSHAGQAQPNSPDQRVMLGGQPAVTQPPGYLVSGCALPTNAGGPCVSAQWVVAATRVTLGGQPAVLQDSQSLCVPTGTPLQVVACQSRVTGV